jgi:hypothetical protein
MGKLVATMSKKDEAAAQAVKDVLCQFAQYTYTLGIYDCLKMVKAVDKVRAQQAKTK